MTGTKPNTIHQGELAVMWEVTAHQQPAAKVSCKLCSGNVITTNDFAYAETVFNKHEGGDHTARNGQSLLKSDRKV